MSFYPISIRHNMPQLMALKLHHHLFRHQIIIIFFSGGDCTHNYYFALSVDNANIDIERFFWVKNQRLKLVELKDDLKDKFNFN